MDTGYEQNTENHEYYIFGAGKILENMMFLYCMWRFSKRNHQKTV